MTVNSVSARETSAGAGVSCTALAAAADALLSQCESFVVSLNDRAYSAESTTMKGGTVGKHLRHTLDHYAAALGFLDGVAPIDYDHRERDVPMETDRRAALAEIALVRRRLAFAAAEPADLRVTVRVMVTGGGDEAELGSSFGRELAFATHHAVHHQAMMKAIASEFAPAVLDASFGKAPSTINHETRSTGR